MTRYIRTNYRPWNETDNPPPAFPYPQGAEPFTLIINEEMLQGTVFPLGEGHFLIEQIINYAYSECNVTIKKGDTRLFWLNLPPNSSYFHSQIPPLQLSGDNIELEIQTYPMKEIKLKIEGWHVKKSDAIGEPVEEEPKPELEERSRIKGLLAGVSDEV